jgi:DNA (cytosine-5)-methyltransferase 1
VIGGSGTLAGRTTHGDHFEHPSENQTGKAKMAKTELTVISLFSGGLGLDLGLESAGFKIRTAIECNRFAAETIRTNRPDIPLIERKIECVRTKTILATAGLEEGEATVVTAGPSCQSFSTAGQRGSVGDPRGTMFRQFVRVVETARPRFFVMENVKGVLSAAIKHRHLKNRGPGHALLEPDEELGSAFRMILKALRATGYYIVFNVLNTANFGVPQIRERVIFIGSRDGERIAMPTPTHAKDGADGLAAWATLREALDGLDDTAPAYHELIPSKRKYLRHVPEGGNWRDLPKRLQEAALGGAFVSWGGRSGFFRRLAWDRPTPALTTKPDSKATMLCHPTELRPLSVAEYTRIQQFPDGWVFAGGIPQQYIQAGNAVPLGLGEAIGNALLVAMKTRKNAELLGRLECADAELLQRMVNRPRTILNPTRMRKDATLEAAKEWLDTKGKRRQGLLKLIDNANEHHKAQRTKAG